MDKASQHAREGDLQYFLGLSEDRLQGLCKAGRKDEDGRSLLHSAAAGGNVQLLELVVQQGGSSAVNDADDEGWTPLQSAVSSGHEAVAAQLISLGADVNAANSGGRTALHYAASKGNASLVRLLLKHGAKVNVQDSTGSTPLHRATSTGKPEVVRVLVEEAGARLDKQDRSGNTPLLVAVSCDAAHISVYLAGRGADLEAANKEGETPLALAGKLRGALLQAAQRGPGGMEDDE